MNMGIPIAQLDLILSDSERSKSVTQISKTLYQVLCIKL